MSGELAEPISRPDIIVPNTTPLVHLAKVGALHLLHEIGGAVILVDVVAHEATREPGKPGAAALAAWIEAGQAPGSNAPVRVEATETGYALALARQVDPTFRGRHAGETAIVEWLATTVQGTDRSTIVLYENGRVPGIVANQGIDAAIDVVTTRAFLELAERRGLLASPADAWDAVTTVTPTANPRVGVSSQRRPAGRRGTRDDGGIG